jgi:putative effector of murein hydrolase
MNFKVSERVVTYLTITSPSKLFHIDAVHYSTGNKWIASFIDYDDSCGVTGLFSSKEELINNLEEFVALSIPLYEKKYAKYGEMPYIEMEDGKLVVDIRSES